MRRSCKSPQGGDGQIRLGDVIVDLAAIQIVRIPGHTGGPSDITEIRLTPTEWRLLAELLNHPGTLLTREHLLSTVWGPGYAKATGNLRLYMSQLRRKLEPDPSQPDGCAPSAAWYRYQPDLQAQDRARGFRAFLLAAGPARWLTLPRRDG